MFNTQDMVGLIKSWLTANFFGAIIEIAKGAIPSICSFTSADMAMSGIPTEKQAKCSSETEQRVLETMNQKLLQQSIEENKMSLI